MSPSVFWAGLRLADREADPEHDPAVPPGNLTPTQSEISMRAFPLR